MNKDFKLKSKIVDINMNAFKINYIGENDEGEQ